MEKEEIKKLIDKKIADAQIDSRSCIFIVIVITISASLLIGFYISVLRHNCDVDHRNEQLQFCKDIYYSDNVVLEQCQDYFVIVERGVDK